MKRIITLSAFLTSMLLASVSSLSAQTATTWIQPRNVTTNQTLLLGQNQVMEVLSLSLDRSTAIDITIEGQTLTFGTGGVTDRLPQPLVVAGPATVVMRRPTSGDEGSIMTFRVVPMQKPSPQTAQVSVR